MLLDDLVQDVPDLVNLLLDHLLRGLDRVDEATLFELVVDEGLEELESHLLGDTALVQTKLWTDNDDGTARVVHPLTEKV